MERSWHGKWARRLLSLENKLKIETMTTLNLISQRARAVAISVRCYQWVLFVNIYIYILVYRQGEKIQSRMTEIGSRNGECGNTHHSIIFNRVALNESYNKLDRRVGRVEQRRWSGVARIATSQTTRMHAL